MTTGQASNPGGVPLRVIFWSLLVLAIVMRLISWSGRTAIETDSVLYISTGVNVARGEGLVDLNHNPLTAKPPLYPILIGAAHWVVGDGEQAARLISFLAGVGLVWLLYRFAKLLWGRKVALWAMGLAAIYPALVNTSTATMAESLTLALEVGGLLLLARFLRAGRWRDLVGCGLMLALGASARPTTSLRAAVAVGLLLLAALPWRATTSRPRLLGAALLALVFFAAVQPTLWFNYTHTGHYSLSPESGAWLWVEMHQSDDAAYERSVARLWDSPLEQRSMAYWLWNEPKALMRQYVTNAFVFYKQTLPKEIVPLLLLLAGLGLSLPPRRGWGVMVALLPMILPSFAWVLMRGTEPRDAVPLAVPLLMLAGAGVTRIWTWGGQIDAAPGGWRYGRLTSLAVVGLMVALCLPAALKYRIDPGGQEVEHKHMGRWIQESIPQAERRIISRKPMVIYYADGVSAGGIAESLEQLRENAMRHDARLLCVDQRYTARYYPELAHILAHPQDAPTWLRPLHRTHAPDGMALQLFAVVQDASPSLSPMH